MLAASELAAMRREAAASLPDRCTILGTVRGRDSRGGDDEPLAEEPLATGVPCLLAPTRVQVSGSESGGLYGPLAAKGLTLDTTSAVWQGVFPHGTALAAAHHLRLETGPAAGQRFEVVTVDDAQGHAVTLGAKLIRAGVTNAD